MKNKPANHITNLKCFDQVAAVIGPAQAQIELFKVVSCGEEVGFSDGDYVLNSFTWCRTPQGFNFWCDVTDGVNPYA